MNTFTLIMFVILTNGSQSAVRTGFDDQLACLSAGKALQQGFLSSPETASAKVVWSCNPTRMSESLPQVPEVIPQPPPPVPERRARPRPRNTPPAEPAPARRVWPAETEEQRAKRTLPEWLGGTKQ